MEDIYLKLIWYFSNGLVLQCNFTNNEYVNMEFELAYHYVASTGPLECHYWRNEMLILLCFLNSHIMYNLNLNF